MKKLFLVVALFCSSVQAADYKSAQRLDDGDVISADVFNDILDRIELTLKPIEVSELVGQWDATQIYCKSGATVVGAADYCQDDEKVLNDTTLVGGSLLSRTDVVTFADNGDGTFSWVNTARDMMFMFNNRDTMRPNTGGLEHTCYLSPTGVAACRLHSSMNHPVDGTIVNMMTVKRTSPTQIVFEQGPTEGGAGTVNFVILNKKALPPEAPTSLSATFDAGTVNLSWTGNDTDFTSYSIQTKDKVDADFSELSTSSSNSYIDELEAGTTRWYRVFATNSTGDSVGSNVIRVENPAVTSADDGS